MKLIYSFQWMLKNTSDRKATMNTSATTSYLKQGHQGCSVADHRNDFKAHFDWLLIFSDLDSKLWDRDQPERRREEEINTMTVTAADVEEWLDGNPDWAQEYVLRKLDINMINKWLMLRGFHTIQVSNPPRAIDATLDIKCSHLSAESQRSMLICTFGCSHELMIFLTLWEGWRLYAHTSHCLWLACFQST